METFQNFLTQVTDLIVIYGGSLLLAIITLMVGFWVISRIVKALIYVSTC